MDHTQGAVIAGDNQWRSAIAGNLIYELPEFCRDNAALGLVRVKANNVFVTQLDPSGSVQRGIDAASPGDTVNVQAGPVAYVEQLEIAKPLTLSGEGTGIQYALGPEVGYLVGDNVLLGIGYNITGFHDQDLSESSYTEHGVFIAMRVQFDEHILDGFSKSKNKRVFLIAGISCVTTKMITSETSSAASVISLSMCAVSITT